MKKLARPHQLDLGLRMRVSDLRFFKVFSAAIVHHNLIAKITPSGFAVLMVLKANSRASDGRIYVGIKDVEEQTGLSATTVRACLRKLIASGYIEQRQEPGKKKIYYVFDEFHFRQLYEGETATDALDELNAGGADGLVRVKYVPVSNREDMAQVEGFLQGGPLPQRASVVMVERQLVASQEVKQQVVQQQLVINAAPGSKVIVNSDGSHRVVDRHEEGLEQLRAIKAKLT